MRVLHWYPNFLGGGATANSVIGLANAHARLGAKVAIATATPLKAPLYGSIEKNISSVELIRWNPARVARRGNLVFRRLSGAAQRALTGLKPDIVHIHGEFNTDNLRVPRLFGSPVVLSPHGAFAPQVFSKGRSLLKRVYFQVARQFLYRHVAAFHALCPMEEMHIRGLLPAARVYRVPQGPGFQAKKALVAKPAGLDPQTVKFLFVGRLDVFTKGLDTLLNAFAEAERRLGDRRLVLTLVGPDWNGGLARLRQQALTLGIVDRVLFTGSLPPEGVHAALHQSDIYIQLSRHEVFSLSVAEALLSGLPAILSENIGLLSWPEIGSLPYVRTVRGSVKDAVEAMVEFVRSLCNLKLVAEQWQSNVSEFFSWDRVASQHLDAYRNLRSPC
jgi:glycosyltransferase involved in cell wall biosynthesis